MQPRVQWCRTTADLQRWIERTSGEPLALDTEADSLHHYPEKVCLIQISCAGADVLVDPLAGADPGVLAPLLGDPERRKILHGGDYDLRILDRDHGLRFRGMFDTMIAARLIGETQFGLAALLAKYCGVSLDKHLQRADWSRRPLPPAMERYAAMDTRFLAELAAILEQRLGELGRIAWAQEEFEILEAVRWNDREDREPFRRLKGAGSLDRRGLAVLRELWNYRDEVARRIDRPPFRVLGNETLVTLARVRPADHDAMTRLLRSGTANGRGWSEERLLTCVAAAQALPDGELPVRRRRRDPTLEGEARQHLEALIRGRDAVARELELERSVLAPRGVLESAVLRAERGADPGATPGLRRWQRQLLAGPLDRLSA